MERRLAAILSYDVVGYSAALGQDERGTLDLMSDQRRQVIDPLLARFGGQVIKRTGDGALVEFSSAVHALAFAREMQVAIGDAVLQYRIGITIGDVVDDGEDVYGDGLNIAARIEPVADPGGIVIHQNLRDQLHGKVEMDLESLGDVTVKNIDRPVPVFKVANAQFPDGVLEQYQGRTRSTRPGPDRRVVWVIATAITGVLAVLIYWFWVAEPANRTGNQLKIAVLPLETPADAPEDQWLGQGISEDIMTELSRFRDLGVIARSSSFRFGGPSPDITALKNELGADFVLTGSVRLQNDQMRLSLQLVDTAADTQIWAESYDRPFADMIAIRQEILNKISARLYSAARNAVGDRVSAHTPKNLKAYELVLRGWRAYYQFTRAGAFEALDMAERSVALDPDYAPAWTLLARALTQFFVQPYDANRGDPAVLNRALEAAQRAVALDPRSAEALAWLGHIYVWTGRHSQGLQDIERALEMNPSNVAAHFIYADSLSRAGRQEDSLKAWAKTKALDPFVAPLNLGLEARSHILLEDFDAGFDLTSECLRRAPRLLPCHLFHIMAASGVGQASEVQRSVQIVKELSPRFSVSGWREIIKYAEPAQGDRLSKYLITSGLAP